MTPAEVLASTLDTCGDDEWERLVAWCSSHMSIARAYPLATNRPPDAYSASCETDLYNIGNRVIGIPCNEEDPIYFAVSANRVLAMTRMAQSEVA